MKYDTYYKHLSFPSDMSSPNPSSTCVFSQTTTVSSSDSHRFDFYQLTLVGTSDATIHTLVPVLISALPYRKALIVKLFFRQILGFVDSPSISVNDLVSIVVSYFDMSIAMA